MSKIIGTKRTFYANAVIREEDIPSTVMKIKGRGKIDGKDLYGFFVTTEEFKKKLASIYCNDGWYNVPIVQYEHGEHIVLAGGSSKKKLPETPESIAREKEFMEKVKAGAFVGQSEINVRKRIAALEVPVRKIGFWHKLGYPFDR